MRWQTFQIWLCQTFSKTFYLKGKSIFNSFLLLSSSSFICNVCRWGADASHLGHWDQLRRLRSDPDQFQLMSQFTLTLSLISLTFASSSGNVILSFSRDSFFYYHLTFVIPSTLYLFHLLLNPELIVWGLFTSFLLVSHVADGKILPWNVSTSRCASWENKNNKNKPFREANHVLINDKSLLFFPAPSVLAPNDPSVFSVDESQ